ncbi:UDP-N-acetylglucosamine 2-epimerase (non-hydrolyzing) [Desulfopila sp. IMCC35006]|uniref:non-hydrolyzing UDP-N-acetylglucosamine 2-epimerase n=1 Tax=Desulfopila sp. IMCC35006 TaxID=2569542 RepID=UPI0010AC58E1|nr:UDP-N-acetylglucosamine 2-epimerase (non-hydrolyzing) [Desulfopila sp. IMCC35006]TKB23971.1 UDP-N-acetylglucosamine 2-epimerase (non-hydrolyzing) [Desulfopila sp. IMCC35006]
MKIVTIIGARPQFIKAAMVSRELVKCKKGAGAPCNQEIVVHTGQHYDYNMSKVFFEELAIPEPDHHLGVGSGSHGHMTGQMIAKIEDVLFDEKPDLVLVYGDTNSTLAGAIAASKLHIPVAHVEAGLRSFNRRMPEEINRVLTDHVSKLLFAPTGTAITNLAREGITDGVIQTGDVMLDAFMHFKTKAAIDSQILDTLGITAGSYYLATVHRQENTDDPHRLAGIFSAFEEISNNGHPVIVPLHPRTRKSLQQNDISVAQGSNVRLVEAVGYLDMIQLEANATLICTDSGGVQKEAYFANVPCITLRDETEWVETVDAGANFLTDTDKQSIFNAFKQASCTSIKLDPALYGNGHAAEIIVDSLTESL